MKNNKINLTPFIQEILNNPETGDDYKKAIEKLRSMPDVAVVSSTETDDIDKLKQNRLHPTQCHLWKKVGLVDTDLQNTFDAVHTFSEDSHFSRRIVMCKDCKQLYLKEFYEVIDWVGGDDAQYWTYIPVHSMFQAYVINKANIFEIMTFVPQIRYDYPTGGPESIRWIGKG